MKRWPLLLLLLGTLVRAQTTRPNIVVIVADDLGWAGVGYHHGFEQTPNIDRIAAKGVELNRFYVSPMCSPTRAGIMTGRYPIRFGMGRSVVRPWDDRGIPASELTLPKALATAGYADRAAFGKWHLGHLQTAFHPISQGFTHFFGCYNGAADYFTRDRDGQIDWHDDFEDASPSGYTTDIVGDAATKYIREHAQQASPFFAYVAFTSVHEPLEPPESASAAWKASGHTPSDKEKLAAMDACMDANIGKILGAINDGGIADRTLIWFLSDNGGIRSIPGNNEPLRAGKLTVYEGGIRTPAAVWWPGHIEGGRKIDTPTMNLDLLPTLCAFAGHPPQGGRPLDGRDVSGVLSDPHASPPDRDIYAFTGQDGLDNEQLSVTTPDGWKLVIKGPDIRRDGVVKSKHSVELFNVVDDPSEKHSRAEEQPQTVQRLTELLIAYRRSEPAEAQPSRNRPPAGFVPPAHWHVPAPATQP